MKTQIMMAMLTILTELLTRFW